MAFPYFEMLSKQVSAGSAGRSKKLGIYMEFCQFHCTASFGWGMHQAATAGPSPSPFIQVVPHLCGNLHEKTLQLLAEPPNYTFNEP